MYIDIFCFFCVCIQLWPILDVLWRHYLAKFLSHSDMIYSTQDRNEKCAAHLHNEVLSEMCFTLNKLCYPDLFQ